VSARRASNTISSIGDAGIIGVSQIVQVVIGGTVEVGLEDETATTLDEEAVQIGKRVSPEMIKH
jgi:hypothetical protein